MRELGRIASALARLAGLDDPEPADLFVHTADEWDALATKKASEAKRLEWEAKHDRSGLERPQPQCERQAAAARELARTCRRNAALIRCGRFA